jgi:hypothetical protein
MMLRLPAKRLAAFLALLAMAPLAKAQKPSSVTLVSPSDWRVVSSSKAELDAVSTYGGDTAIDREYGVKSVEVRAFESGPKSVKVLVEPTPDAPAAYGLITFYRKESMTPVSGVPLAYAGTDEAILAWGRFFYRIPRATNISEHDLQAILQLLANSHTPGEAKETLPDPLPEKGLVPGSEKFLLGDEAARRALPSFRTDLLGFAQGAEVQVGNYLFGKDRATLLVIEYPTPQISHARFGEMERNLALNQDRGAGSTYGRRLGSYVILVLNPGTPATATSLMDVFNVAGQITQNQPNITAKSVVIQMGQLILANIIFVMILGCIAVGGGFIFYLSHEVFKRWLPNTQWGAQDEATITRLKLN